MLIRALFLLFLLALACGAQSVPSPDGRLVLDFSIAASGPNSGWLVYSVTFRGQPVLAASRLGLDPLNQPPLGQGLKVLSATPGSVDESYNVPHGKANPIRNRANTLLLSLEESAGLTRRFEIEARAYDDGVAFRYRVPQQNALRDLLLEKELTQFNFAREGAAYPLVLNSFRTSYEDSYQVLPLSSIKTNALVALPFLAEIPGAGWAAVTEAHLENFAGLYLMRGPGLIMEARLSPRADNPELAVQLETPAQTPWRVIQVAAEPAHLIGSNIVYNLNPPARIADTSWIKPGKTAWDWWSGGFAKNVPFQPGMNTETLKHYIDFCAEAKIDYMLIDEGWSTNNARGQGDLTQINPRVDILGVMRHAASKGVGIWLWAHWAAVDKQMDQVFPQFQKWGVKGVKIDFMDRDDQWMVNFYYRTAAKAAEHKLMIDWHGAYKPTGMSRTWPNVMTYEGVMGAEYHKWSARVTPDHNTVIPFTRMLAGPLDYTPGGFTNVTKANFRPRNVEPMVPTTRAHQLALFVIFESAFQMLADYPENYRGTKELEFLQAVPVAWDETRGLAGEPGKWVAVARRRGPDWYVGVISNSDARTVEVPLSFLAAGSWQAELYADDPAGPANTALETRPLTASTSLRLNLSPAGGAALRLRRAR